MSISVIALGVKCRSMAANDSTMDGAPNAAEAHHALTTGDQQ